MYAIHVKEYSVDGTVWGAQWELEKKIRNLLAQSFIQHWQHINKEVVANHLYDNTDRI